MKQYHLLVVDDEKRFADMLAKRLMLRGCHCDVCYRGPVIVLVLDAAKMGDYQKMVGELRAAGIRAELYLGGSGMRAQLKYADKRHAPIAVIAGEDEFAAGEVTLKDLLLGSRLSAEISDNKAWREDQPAQISVPRAELVAAVRDMLARDLPAV